MQYVRDIMTRDVVVASPNDSLQKAASLMGAQDVGSLPVGEQDRLIGMITDRDIVLRAVAEGRNSETPVREVMTSKIRYCFDDADVEAVAKNMSDLQVRRLPVVNRDKRLVGILALSNVACGKRTSATQQFLKSVAAPH